MGRSRLGIVNWYLVIPKLGPEGLEPSPVRLRAGCAAANTSIPFRYDLFGRASPDVCRWFLIARRVSGAFVRSVPAKAVLTTQPSVHTLSSRSFRTRPSTAYLTGSQLIRTALPRLSRHCLYVAVFILILSVGPDGFEPSSCPYKEPALTIELRAAG